VESITDAFDLGEYDATIAKPFYRMIGQEPHVRDDGSHVNGQVDIRPLVADPSCRPSGRMGRSATCGSNRSHELRSRRRPKGWGSGLRESTTVIGAVSRGALLRLTIWNCIENHCADIADAPQILLQQISISKEDHRTI
jgi:hypothetical protein